MYIYIYIYIYIRSLLAHLRAHSGASSYVHHMLLSLPGRSRICCTDTNADADSLPYTHVLMPVPIITASWRGVPSLTQSKRASR